MHGKHGLLDIPEVGSGTLGGEVYSNLGFAEYQACKAQVNCVIYPYETFCNSL